MISALTGLARILSRRRRDGREVIEVSEHCETVLPKGIIRQDGSFDLYDDVQKKFEIRYSTGAGRHVIRPGGWVGYLPLNDRHALRIQTRVPVANLEQIISRSSNTKVYELSRYSRLYGHSSENPQALYDVVADAFLCSLDAIWGEGLEKSYRRRSWISSRPFGRVDSYRTALMQAETSRATAVFTAHFRTVDHGPNRVLKSALERLDASYRAVEQEKAQRRRRQWIRAALRRLDGVGVADEVEASAQSTERYIRWLPAHRGAYVDALRLAQLITNNFGFLLRAGSGLAVLPVILVDMASIFEDYARSVLKRELSRVGSLTVLDGNVGGSGGAKRKLFRKFDADGSIPEATPDIVIRRGTQQVVAIVDVKYKPAKVIPDRSEVNQIMCYGAVYECRKVVILYPQKLGGGRSLSSLGLIGETQVYRAGLDLSVQHLESEEESFGVALMEELRE